MAIYTKFGDDGSTRLLNGEVVSKDDIRIALIGDLDELNSYLGLVRASLNEDGLAAFLTVIQTRLTTIMAQITAGNADTHVIRRRNVSEIEAEIDALSAKIPPQNQFVLPGGDEVSAQVDIARTVARRVERLMTAVSSQYFVCQISKQFINRLSDYLFVLARYIEFTAKIEAEVRKAVAGLIAEKNDKINSYANSGITLEAAKKLIEQIELKSAEMGIRTVICVSGPNGRPVAVHVMDDAYLASYEIAVGKAYTSVALKMPTSELKKLTAPGQPLYGLESLKNEKIVSIGGGMVLFNGSAVVGGLGVSGASEEEDTQLANYGKEVFTVGL